MIRRRALGQGLLVAVAATLLAVWSPSAAVTLDLRVYDLLVRAAAARPPSPSVAIVAIDDGSLAEIGQWPWPRDVLARLVDGIRRLGARVVALDMLLAEPDRFGGAGTSGASQTDAALAEVLAGGRVVVAYALTFDARQAGRSPCVLHPAPIVAVQPPGQPSPVDQLFQATGVVCSLPELMRAAGASGYLNESPDRDGLLRRLPLLMAFEGQVYPTLALAAVQRAAGGGRLTLAGSGGGRARLEMTDRRFLLDERGTLPIRFRGRRGTYTEVRASDILGGRVPAGTLKDRIVFVGATALGIQDIVSTPVDRAMPGIEVHAAAADTLLQGDVVSAPPYSRAYELVATFGLGAAATLLVATLGVITASGLATGLVILLWAATFWAVSARGLFLSPVYPTTGVVLVVLVLIAERVRHERTRAELERARLKQANQFTVESLTSLLETRDGVTGRHARRTQAYSRLVAGRLALLPRFREALTPDAIEMLSELAPLHDIGKVGVRDAVLNKPGALSAEEMGEMQHHPGFGYETIARAEQIAGGGGKEALLSLAKDIVYTHHERWDGTGYPRGLRGDEIPVAGRIIALVDVYDALSNTRPYRASLPHDRAVAVIVAGRGTHFDPDVVDAFLAVEDRFRELSLALGDDDAGPRAIRRTPGRVD